MPPENSQFNNKTSTLEKLSIPIAIVIAGAIIGGALYYSNFKGAQVVAKSKALLGNSNAKSSNMRPISPEDHILGNPNAEVILVEYSDTECPFCKQFHTTLRRVMNEYGKDGKVAWVYRHFPIVGLHSKAPKEAEALECAAELGGNGKFWEYTNLLYDTTPANNGLDAAELPKMAKTVGLDVNAFNSCLSSGRYTKKVQTDYENAVASGGQGTPTSILVSKDGTKTIIEGAYPYEQLKQIIDAALEG